MSGFDYRSGHYLQLFPLIKKETMMIAISGLSEGIYSVGKAIRLQAQLDQIKAENKELKLLTTGYKLITKLIEQLKKDKFNISKEEYAQRT
jgi:hypothetical protein